MWLWHNSSGLFVDEKGRPLQKLSTSTKSRAAKQQKGKESAEDDPMVSFHEDLESFRKEVDRAMERDPYGTLFGRRLWSPPSSNNMSWTTFSWFADPKEIKDNPADQQPSQPSADMTSSSSTSTAGSGPSSPRSQASSPQTSRSTPTSGDVYVYDPIIGRKVLKPRSENNTASSNESFKADDGFAKVFDDAVQRIDNTISSFSQTVQRIDKTISSAGQTAHDFASPSTGKVRQSLESAAKSSESTYTPDGPRKSIFETLFGENNAVDIPVKKYVPPKVYGYGDKTATTTESETATSAVKKSAFENSRKREFQALRAATLGNTIDTSAEFHGKYADASAVVPPEKTSTNDPEPTQPQPDPAPFTGTTYAGRAAAILNTSGKSRWLQKEGFTGSKEATQTPTDSPKFTFEKLQPALDRSNVTSKKPDVLQPALDRSTKAKRVISPAELSSKAEAYEKKVDAAEKAEDIDLLRSSDVRRQIPAKSVRTKQDIETLRKARRRSLEKHFNSNQNQTDPPTMPSVAAPLNTLWKHVENNPAGIVAKTLRSLNLSTEKPASEPRKKSITPVESSSPVSAPLAQSEKKISASVIHTELAKPHPLSEATVKEGVPRYPEIENHTRVFEPRYAQLKEQLKDVRKTLYYSKLELASMRRRTASALLTKFENWSVDSREGHINRLRQQAETLRKARDVAKGRREVEEAMADLGKQWRDSEAERLAEYAKVPLIEEDGSAAGFDEPVFTEKKKTAAQPEVVEPAKAQATGPVKRDTDPRSLDEPVGSHSPSPAKSESAPVLKVEPPIFTPAESKVWNDEQPPPIAELKAAIAQQFTSPFVMLINNGKSGVRAVPAPNLPHLAGRKAANPFEVLAALDQAKAAEFLAYFPRLQQAGYELVGGDANKLTFRKTPPAVAPAEKKKAATVLDEIPAEIDPPGPSAPIPPPASSSRISERADLLKRQPPVRRQEQVFSGTTTAPPRPSAAKAAAAESKAAAMAAADELLSSRPFARFVRAFQRVTYTIITLAAGTYTIGLISEGVGAQAQVEGGVHGPRKRIVLPVQEVDGGAVRGTRPGIYSTESSR
ncbi:uncharacterized protein AB675_1947 [Cyphellophora attinorum]|uniref:Uncharacterized protein n=1 Tax=Cyphellophora attinorum TaxID=1664694 RepID=A0A0N1P047_9EURO|nr:uncharacterized protein AB675_1947 [Phialophora attinorum]KPI42996.1 hypothetical protein AB675_1947 [Phialophora attinorum]